MSISYGISWIYEEFQATRLSHGKSVECWSSPDPVNNLEDFHIALNTAYTVLEMHKGGDVAVTYESDDHVHTFLDIPPMSVKDLEKYLERRVEKEKSFKEPAAWAYRAVRHGDKGEGVLLHMMPASIRDAIMRICEENHLTPRLLVPLTDVMADHFADTDTDNKQHALLVALFKSRVEMVVVTAKGEALLVRELAFHWQDANLERLRKDLDRTLLYAKQRFGDAVSRISVLGVDALVAAEQLKPHFKTMVSADEASVDPLFWAAEVSALPLRTKSNFIPVMMQRAITGKQLLRMGKRMAVAACVMAVVLGVSVELMIMKYGNVDSDILQKHNALIDKKNYWQNKNSNLDESRHRLAQLENNMPPLPAWFFSNLGDLMPKAMVLNKAELAWSDNQWHFELKGQSKPSLAKTASTLDNLELALSRSPWNASVSSSWEAAWVKQLSQGRATETDLIAFSMEGVMK
jgi:hypothetical protein